MIAEYALLLLLTNGSYAPPELATTDDRSSLSATSPYGQRIDLAANSMANTGTFQQVTYVTNYQTDLLALLNEWIETDPIEADPDYEAQKAEMEKNRVSFGVV
jgi:hypothetical protein